MYYAKKLVHLKPSRLFALGLASLLVGCTHATVDEVEPGAPAPRDDGADLPLARPELDGRQFPDGVLALTWDDGPDDETLALAEYLHLRRVSGTFFVVGSWMDGASSDPGFGRDVYATGHEHLPVLGDLVALGHRLGNHTLHHALLGNASAEVVEYELRENQERIDPYIRNELRIFRAPGGYWSAAASRAVDADSYLSQLVGPLRWDVDAKDWEESVYCQSARPAAECEHRGGRGALRVRADVVARRYLDAIDSARSTTGRMGHGIVLLHDRVGDVGSDYALEIARILVPRLEERGYVFAAPLLQLSPPTTRARFAASSKEARVGDVDGDGLADACTLGDGVVECRLAAWDAEPAAEDGEPAKGSRVPHVGFVAPRARRAVLPAAAGAFELADVDGDRRADACARTLSGIACALSGAEGFAPVRSWSISGELPEVVRFGDVDGDGRADACGLTPRGVMCARREAGGYAPARVWIRGAPPSASEHADLALADVDGDGDADACVATSAGIFCAISTRAAFTRWVKWSSDLADASQVVFGDLNGDGRADACGLVLGALRCAFSNGKAFTRATTWLQWAPEGVLHPGDINGDGRTDICALLPADERGRPIACAVAP